jgi:L-rhamnose mutarotase
MDWYTVACGAVIDIYEELTEAGTRNHQIFLSRCYLFDYQEFEFEVTATSLIHIQIIYDWV